ncbi:MAG: glycosyltransferase [Planctomycetaceae bacterium]
MCYESHDCVGYVVKRYPRFSETFIVNEVLAHEAAGLDVEIFSLRPPVDTHFQNRISEVRAPVTYLDRDNRGGKSDVFWAAIQEAELKLPEFSSKLALAQGEDAKDTIQAIQLALMTQERDIRHLHAHFASSAASVARMAAHFAGIPYTLTAHAKDIFHEEVESDDLRRKLTDASSVITVSDFNLQYLRKTFGPSASRVVRVYNGLDLHQYPFLLPADRPRQIIGVGRLVEKKGFNDLITACAILAEHRDDFHCEIIGDGECGRELQDQILELGIADRVKLIGPQPQSQVIAAMQSSAVLAAPCIVGGDGNRDGLPTVLLEAMALGTPCVGTDVTGIPEVLRHEQTGLLVGQHDPHALARALERLLDDPVLRIRLASRARDLIAAEFDAHANAGAVREQFVGLKGSISECDSYSHLDVPAMLQEVS